MAPAATADAFLAASKRPSSNPAERKTRHASCTAGRAVFVGSSHRFVGAEQGDTGVWVFSDPRKAIEKMLEWRPPRYTKSLPKAKILFARGEPLLSHRLGIRTAALGFLVFGWAVSAQAQATPQDAVRAFMDGFNSGDMAKAAAVNSASGTSISTSSLRLPGAARRHSMNGAPDSRPSRKPLGSPNRRSR